MAGFADHGSGIIIRTACGSVRPAITSSSSTLSKVAVSLPPGRITGRIFARSSPRTFDCSRPSRARIQLALPRSVLISPLCATNRYGWASGHDGNVFVENRWCTRARADSKASFNRSGNMPPSCDAVSMPL